MRLRFGPEVQALAEKFPGLLPVKQALPVKETEDDHLDKLRQLAVLYQALRAREASIRQRVDEPHPGERGRRGPASARTVLNEFGLLAHANPVVQEATEAEIVSRSLKRSKLG